jgi:hypothetical protein
VTGGSQGRCIKGFAIVPRGPCRIKRGDDGSLNSIVEAFFLGRKDEAVELRITGTRRVVE